MSIHLNDITIIPCADCPLIYAKRDTGTFISTGTSGADGKYTFMGVPTVNMSLKVGESGRQQTRRRESAT